MQETHLPLLRHRYYGTACSVASMTGLGDCSTVGTEVTGAIVGIGVSVHTGVGVNVGVADGAGVFVGTSMNVSVGDSVGI